jgi:nucleotide sugar dehydrogenase
MVNTVCVVGVGFVGESLVEIFAKKNNVIGIDISPKQVEILQRKFKNYPNIKIQTTHEGIEKCQLICIAVPTLLNDDNSVDDTYIKNAVKVIEEHVAENTTIVMESSVYVGMTRKLLQHLRQKNIYIGFSPERIDPGRVNPPVDRTAKIISGIDEESLAKIKYFYEEVFETVVPVSTLETAEMCKLVENCFRMVNIAYVNEVSNACEKLSIDPHELISACSTKPFGYMPFYPGLGIGGHCIPINPRWLAVTSKDELPLLMYATELMTLRPIVEANKLLEKYPRVKRALVIGMAFKPGEKLTTNSAGLAFANALVNKNIHVSVYDPLVDKNNIDKKFGVLEQSEFTSEFIEKHFDAVCVAIKQTNIDWKILDKCKNIIIKKYVEI